MASLQRALVKAKLVENRPGLIPKEKSTAVYAVFDAVDILQFIILTKAELLENPLRINGIIEVAHKKFDEKTDGFSKLLCGLYEIQRNYQTLPIRECLKFLD